MLLKVTKIKSLTTNPYERLTTIYRISAISTILTKDRRQTTNRSIDDGILRGDNILRTPTVIILGNLFDMRLKTYAITTNRRNGFRRTRILIRMVLNTKITFLVSMIMSIDNLTIIGGSLTTIRISLRAVNTSNVINTNNGNTNDTIDRLSRRNRIILGTSIAVTTISILKRSLRKSATSPLPRIRLVKDLVSRSATTFTTPNDAPYTLLMMTIQAPPKISRPLETTSLTRLATNGSLLSLLMRLINALIRRSTRKGFKVDLDTNSRLLGVLTTSANKLLTRGIRTVLRDMSKSLIIRMIEGNNSSNVGHTTNSRVLPVLRRKRVKMLLLTRLLLLKISVARDTRYTIIKTQYTSRTKRQDKDINRRTDVTTTLDASASRTVAGLSFDLFRLGLLLFYLLRWGFTEVSRDT